MTGEKTIYVPQICYSVREDNGGICDVVLQGFFEEKDARDLYPDAPIISVLIPSEKVLG